MSLALGLFVEMPTETTSGREPDDPLYKRQHLILRRLGVTIDPLKVSARVHIYENAQRIRFDPASHRWPELVIGFGIYDRETGVLRAAEYAENTGVAVGRDEHVELQEGALRLEISDAFLPVIAGADFEE